MLGRAAQRKGRSVPKWLWMKERGYEAGDILSHFGVVRPPIDIEALAAQLDVVVTPVSGVRWSGAVQVHDYAEIWVSMNDAPARRRFTVAHELGHLLLHPLGKLQKAYRDVSFNGDPAESEANAFAADLLMPLGMLQRYVLQYGVDAARLAAAFQVSEQAMNIRLGKMLGIAHLNER